MGQAYDPFLDSQITHDEERGLTWVKVSTRDRYGSDEVGPPYDTWLLFHSESGRMLVSIDGPEPSRFCYCVDPDKGERRKFICFADAERYALEVAEAVVKPPTEDPVPSKFRAAIRKVFHT